MSMTFTVKSKMLGWDLQHCSQCDYVKFDQASWLFLVFSSVFCVWIIRTINLIQYKLRWANIYVSTNYFSFNSTSILKDTEGKRRPCFSQQRCPSMAALIPDNIDRIF